MWTTRAACRAPRTAGMPALIRLSSAAEVARTAARILATSASGGFDP